MSNSTFEVHLCNPINRLETQEAQLFYLCFLVIRMFVAFFTISFNVIFFVTIVSDKQLQKTIFQNLIMILSLIDLLQGLICWPVTIYINVCWYYIISYSCFWSHIMYSIGYGFGFATVTIIVVLSLDQYLAVVHPYFYAGKVTLGRLCLPLVPLHLALYAFNIAGRFQYHTIWPVYRFCIAAIILILLLVLAYSHIQTMRHASLAIRKINQTNREEGQRVRSRARAAKSTMIVLVASVLCYLPLVCYSTYEMIGKETAFSRTYLKFSADFLAMSSSAVDPVVFYCRLKTVRTATRRMLQSMCWRRGRVLPS